MTCIQAASSFVPDERVPVGAYLRKYGLNEARIRVHERYFGFSEIRLDSRGGLYDMLVGAAGGLAGLAEQKERIRYVIHARTMPVVAPYPANPLQDACRALGLDPSSAFSLTQHACASSLLAVDLAGRLLAGAGDTDGLVLILAADKAFTASAQVIADTGVMGEGAAAVLVGLVGDRDRVVGYATRTHGRFYEGPWMPVELDAIFRTVYPEALAEVVLGAVKCAGLDIDDIALILPHNVNRMSWLKALKLMGVRGADRLYLDNLPLLGHCFGADPFINYLSAVASDRLKPEDHYVMTAVGQGATFSAMVLRH